MGISSHCLASSVSLLRAAEVEDIIEGNDEKYKAVSVHSSEVVMPTSTKAKKPMSWVSTIFIDVIEIIDKI